MTDMLQVGSSARTTVLSSQGLATLRDNIVAVFGTRVASAMEPIDICITPDARLTGCEVASV